ncbi:MAG TPA: serine hydrolase, partial [Roseiflexaceae bacterium]|nr:serine hydrolase [Roseiflexaceae bacterium]
EWAVQRQVLTLPGPGNYMLTTPPIVVWNKQTASDMWMRLTLTSSTVAFPDGSGPMNGYATGETEDYLLEGAPLPLAIPPQQPQPTAAGDFVALEPHPGFQINLPFVAAPRGGIDGPGGIAVPAGKLKEVDVAHIGGSTGGPNLPLVVTAAGTGATVRLSSWRVVAAQQDPVHLAESANLVGYNVKLHVLTPRVSPDLTYNLLVSALLDTQQRLWLTTWRLQPDGQFVKLSTRGYGSRDVPIQEYAIAHRPVERENGTVDTFQVVTPIRAANGSLRLITWSVNPATGAINGQHDSGPWGAAAGDTTLAISRLNDQGATGRHYNVSFRDSGGSVQNWLWEVNNAHVPFYRGDADTGLSLRGTSNVTIAASEMATSALNESGFAMAYMSASGLRVSSWEQRQTFCSDTGCLYTPFRIATNTDDGSQMSPGVQLSQPSVTTSRALMVDARGADELDDTTTLFQKGDNNLQGVASIRKVMVLLVTIDAIHAGEVSLGDVVTVSEAAANHPGSSAGLVEGEQQTLNTLLHGMMMVSGGDATQAVIEHVGGTDAEFVERMAAKAADLGMSNSVYCGTGGYCYSTTEDQVKLWLGAYKEPLFQQIAGAEFYSECGVDQDGDPVCHDWSKNVSSLYPGVESHKTGGTGFSCSEQVGVPLCASQGCLSIQATRLSHTLVLNELQPAGLAADRWNDAYDLFDYGFQRLFTPDFRGANTTEGGSASDFGVAMLDDTQFVSAALSNGKLKLSSWQIVAGIGQVGLLGSSERSYSMPGGAQAVAPATLAITRIGTLEADGDYLTGQLNGGNLEWRVWRVAAKP